MRAAAAALGLALLLPLGLAAQDEAPPEDFKVRTDRPGQDASELYFVDMPPGWHVTSGPAAIYWDPSTMAEGSYRVEMEVYLFDPGQRREAFGFFVGGSELEGPDQRYTYFLVRNGGEFLVKERVGSEAPTLVPWTAHEAVLSYADRDEGEASVLNVLAAEIGAEEVRFFVNDREVHRMPRGAMALDGVVGFRVNHGLNLHISRLDVTPEG